jgi:hypothetical protein
MKEQPKNPFCLYFNDFYQARPGQPPRFAMKKRRLTDERLTRAWD